MTPNDPQPSEPSDTALPEGLVEAMRSLDEAPGIDPQRDRQTLAAVQPHLLAGQARRQWWLRAKIGTGLAAAACLALFLLIDVESTRNDEAPVAPVASRPGETAHPDDLNADGRVDILDAFFMQRSIDLGDEAYTPQDVRRLRRQIVGVAG